MPLSLKDHKCFDNRGHDPCAICLEVGDISFNTIAYLRKLGILFKWLIDRLNKFFLNFHFDSKDNLKQNSGNWKAIAFRGAIIS